MVLKTFLASAASMMAISMHSRLAEKTTKPEESIKGVPDIAAVMSVPLDAFVSYQIGHLVRGDLSNLDASPLLPIATVGKRWACASSPSFTWGDEDDGGIGVTITNADGDWRGFYIYQNLCDKIPFKYVWVRAQQTVFVSLPPEFQGRITRGTDEWNLGGVARPLGTWFEIALDNRSWIWGDVSLIRGCDGPVLMWALDGSGAWKGFIQDIIDGAPSGPSPSGAYDMKPSGQLVVAATENWDGSTNIVPMIWDLETVGPEYVYVDDSHGNPVIASKDGRFATFWPRGML